MLSGWMVGRFREPIRDKARGRKWNTQVAPKGATPMFPAFYLFFVP